MNKKTGSKKSVKSKGNKSSSATKKGKITAKKATTSTVSKAQKSKKAKIIRVINTGKRKIKAKSKAKKRSNSATKQIELELGSGKSPVILQVLPELKSGGVERGTIEVAKYGQANGYTMIVASAGGYFSAQLENANIQHIKLPLASKNPFTILCNIFRLIKIIRKYNVDIVHARSRAPAWSAYFAAKRAKCHFLTTVHGLHSMRGPFKKLYNNIMTKGELVIAISNFIKEHIIENYGVDEKIIRVVPRGVDLDHFTREKVHKIRMINMAEKFKIELDVPVLLLPGRFTRWKGQEFLIDALELIKDENFVCIFAGYDKKHENYYRSLERKVRDKNLFQRVRMIGEVKDMPALYSLSDIVISASLRPEAFGRIAIEGQAMEKLVVATRHGGACETIKDEETGWLVTPNDIEGLAKILRDLLNIGQRQRKLVTTKARKSVENNFSLQNMAQKTFAVYDELLGRKKPL